MRLMKYKDLELYVPSPKVELAGYWKLDAIRSDGRVRPLTGWFPNLITNLGLNNIGAGGPWLATCVVGSGTTAPVVGDTVLESLIGSTTAKQSAVSSAQGSEPYYGAHTVVYRFAIGAATGILAEIGVGYQTTGLFSRALILDGLGDPTTVTILADEQLDATYQIRHYPPLSDIVDTLTITGSGDHNYTLRAAGVTNTTDWASDSITGWIAGANNNSTTFYANAVLNAITSAITGTSIKTMTPVNASYTQDSFNKSFSMTLGLNDANHANGITGINIACNQGKYQIKFDDPIMKDATKTLVLNANLAWARKTL